MKKVTTSVQPIDEPNALTTRIKFPAIQGNTPGEQINYLHNLAVETGKMSIAAAIYAGWILSKIKDRTPHGDWYAWLAGNTEVSPATALRYMTVYANTVGAARAALPEPPDRPPTMTELREASANVEAKTVSQLYSQLKLTRASGSWGGHREGAGRKAKNSGKSVEQALEDAAHLEPLLWAAAKGSLDTLVQLDAERDYLHRLSDEHLANLSQTLTILAQAAAAAFLQRTGDNPPPAWQMSVKKF